MFVDLGFLGGSRTHARRAAMRVSSIAVWCVVLSTLGQGLAAQAEPSRPAWNGHDIDGRPVRLDRLGDTRGLVLVVLGTDCPISNRYVPTLNAIATSARDVAFFGVVSDAAATRATAQRHRDRFRIAFPVLLDGDGTLAAHLGPTHVPEAFVFDAAGRPVYRGRIDDSWVRIGVPRPRPRTHDLRDVVTSIVAGDPPAWRRTQPVGCLFERPVGREADPQPAFTDVARSVGLDLQAFRSGFTDLDGDGWPDLVLLSARKATATDGLRIFANVAAEGEGRRFVERTAASGVLASRRGRDRMGRVVSLFVTADVDGDGREDVFTGAFCDLERSRDKPDDHGDRNEVLLNRGDWRFELAPKSDLQRFPDTIAAAAFVDVDRDGRIDLFTGAQYRDYGRSRAAYPDRLFRGRGDGRFQERTKRAKLLDLDRKGTRAGHRPTYGVAHTDVDNDGRQDLLVCAYGRQWNVLWRQRAGGTFVDVAARVGFDGDAVRHGRYPPWTRRRAERPFRANGNTFDAAVADFDNDGDMDVFLAEICHAWAGPSSDRSSLLVNLGPEHDFAFRRERRGIERRHEVERWNEGDIHAGWLDYDNDGLLDLLLASSDYPDDQFLRLFRQKPDHTFEDVTARAGFDLRNATQISLADFDRDGDVDIVVGTSNNRLTKAQREGRDLNVRLFRNDVGHRNHWFALRLEGKGPGGANRSAIGARVQVRIGDVTQTREVYGGQGHAGHQDGKTLHFGLGACAVVDEVIVRWPDRRGTVVRFEKVEADAYYTLREGATLTR